MLLNEIIGAWLAAFLTISILSFLYKENPLYKIAEHLFVGTSAGWGVVIAYWQVIQPDLLGSLWPEKGYDSGSFFSEIWYGVYNIIFEIKNFLNFDLFSIKYLGKNISSNFFNL